jgi:hypothetical protein
MFKKIQQYLLLHYPLLWNVKIVPVMAILLILHIALFAIGYFSTQFENLTTYEGYNEISTYPLVFVFCLAVILIILILWLIRYSRNNAFRVFYPQSSASLYGEWLMILLIVFALFSLPFTHIKGVETKVKSFVAGKEEVAQNIKLINQIYCLIPTTKNDFMEIEEGADKNYSFSLLNQSFENTPVSTGLLNADNQKTVQQWLITENEVQIRLLIRNFLRLAEKHHLKSTLTVEKWMELIYNPPYYPVTGDNLIARDFEDPSLDYSEYAKLNRVPFIELKQAYIDIYRAYYDNQTSNYVLVILCLAGIVSLLIFSCRCTDRKSWLIALVASFVALVAYGIFSVLISFFLSGHSIGLFMTLFWLCVFIFELVYVIRLICDSLSKKYSGVMINHLFWMLPYIPLMLYGLYQNINNKGDDSFVDVIWVSVALAFATVGLLIHYIVRRWKSLPEQ